LNVYGFVCNDTIGTVDILGLESPIEIKGVTLAQIIAFGDSHNPTSIGSEHCAHIIFFYSGSGWARKQDENYITHVAIMVGKAPPLGFYPQSDGGFLEEDGTHVALIMRCCCYSRVDIMEIANYINKHRPKKGSKVEKLDGKYWQFNENNCATFVFNALTYVNPATGKRVFRGSNPTEFRLKWDSKWGPGEGKPAPDNIRTKGLGHRPEELRRALQSNSKCSETFINLRWLDAGGRLSNTK